VADRSDPEKAARFLVVSRRPCCTGDTWSTGRGSTSPRSAGRRPPWRARSAPASPHRGAEDPARPRPGAGSAVGPALRRLYEPNEENVATGAATPIRSRAADRHRAAHVPRLKLRQPDYDTDRTSARLAAGRERRQHPALAVRDHRRAFVHRARLRQPAGTACTTSPARRARLRWAPCSRLPHRRHRTGHAGRHRAAAKRRGTSPVRGQTVGRRQGTADSLIPFITRRCTTPRLLAAAPDRRGKAGPAGECRPALHLGVAGGPRRAEAARLLFSATRIRLTIPRLTRSTARSFEWHAEFSTTKIPTRRSAWIRSAWP